MFFEFCYNEKLLTFVLLCGKSLVILQYASDNNMACFIYELYSYSHLQSSITCLKISFLREPLQCDSSHFQTFEYIIYQVLGKH